MPVLKNDVIESLTFLCLSERHQAMLDELHLLMQTVKVPKVMIDMNSLESEFLEYKSIPDD